MFVEVVKVVKVVGVLEHHMQVGIVRHELSVLRRRQNPVEG